MSWFGPETLTFLDDLREHNNRDWFAANRKTWERHVRDAARTFADGLAGALADSVGRPHTCKIYRINRDLRFSKDKIPYNTHVHMSLWPEGSAGPVWMLGLEPGKLTHGGGIMAFTADQLARWRHRASGPAGEELSDLLAGLIADGARLPDPDLKRVPAPYEQSHVRADLLRRKSLTVWRDAETVTDSFGPKGPAHSLTALLEFRPVMDWLAEMQ